MEIAIKEAANILNLSIATVRRYIKSGKLSARKEPKGLRFLYFVNKADVERLRKELLNAVE